MSQYKLTYFDVRGLGEHIRFLFIAAEVPYEDIKVPHKEWPQLKSNFKFGQVPTLEVDGRELSQSLAIARFLALKFNFVADDPFLAAKADEIVDFATELRLEFRLWVIEKDEIVKSQRKEILVNETFSRYYDILEGLAAPQVGNFISGDKVCWQDFFIANWLEIWGELVVGEDYLNKFPKLKKIKESVFAIPSIKSYLSKREKSFI